MIQNISTLEELHTALDTDGRVVVVFSARDWCIPCQRLNPHVEAAAEALTDVTFVEVDIDKAPDIQHAYDIMSVPTVLSFDRGSVNTVVKGRTAPVLIRELS